MNENNMFVRYLELEEEYMKQQEQLKALIKFITDNDIIGAMEYIYKENLIKKEVKEDE